MIGDEFIAGVTSAERHVVTHPIVEGVSEWLTSLLALFDVDDVRYLTYVDASGHQVVPMLVVIIAGVRR